MQVKCDKLFFSINGFQKEHPLYNKVKSGISKIKKKFTHFGYTTIKGELNDKEKKIKISKDLQNFDNSNGHLLVYIISQDGYQTKDGMDVYFGINDFLYSFNKIINAFTKYGINKVFIISECSMIIRDDIQIAKEKEPGEIEYAILSKVKSGQQSTFIEDPKSNELWFPNIFTELISNMRSEEITISSIEKRLTSVMTLNIFDFNIYKCSSNYILNYKLFEPQVYISDIIYDYIFYFDKGPKSKIILNLQEQFGNWKLCEIPFCKELVCYFYTILEKTFLFVFNTKSNSENPLRPFTCQPPLSRKLCIYLSSDTCNFPVDDLNLEEKIGKDDYTLLNFGTRNIESLYYRHEAFVNLVGTVARCAIHTAKMLDVKDTNSFLSLLK